MTAIPFRRDGIEVLRAFVGNDGFVDDFLTKKRNDYTTVLSCVCLMDP